jgi:outer membrane protein OmpA-like peptidoglycan-associated protein
MKVRYLLLVAALCLFGPGSLFGQAPAQEPAVLVLPQPPIIFGTEQRDFVQNIKDILFAFDDCECGLDNAALKANVEWLKAHPNVRFYVNGYADVRGDVLYNVSLAQRRADKVKAALIKLGISEDRIVTAAGWGELIGVCAEQTDECYTLNRRVRLRFATSEPKLSASTN